MGVWSGQDSWRGAVRGYNDWLLGRCENIKSLKMYFPQMILGVCHFEYNKPRFYGNFFSKKNSFKGGFKTQVLSF